jgi:YggT family protein
MRKNFINRRHYQFCGRRGQWTILSRESQGCWISFSAVDNIIAGITRVLDIILEVYMWVIIIRALISWVSPDPYNPIVQLLSRLTEPMLRPIRKLVPPHKVGIDLSPLIAVLFIIFLQYAVIKNLYRLAYSLG